MINKVDLVKILICYRENYRENGTSLSDACKRVLKRDNIADEFLEVRNIIDTKKERDLLSEVGLDVDELKSNSWKKYNKARNEYIESFGNRFNKCVCW